MFTSKQYSHDCIWTALTTFHTLINRVEGQGGTESVYMLSVNQKLLTRILSPNLLVALYGVWYENNIMLDFSLHIILL